MDMGDTDTTKTLASKLGLIETLHVGTIKRNSHSVQTFKYLLVLDFETTCWDRWNGWNAGPRRQERHEIIEFPVVLYQIETGEILSKFQQYVMPTENPILSKFCIEFTGIEQKQVENGVPISTALMLFKRWLQEQEDKYQMKPHKDGSSDANSYVCATWSDWDLGMCLNYECQRKKVKKPAVFSKWIDLKALYREFYNRRPKGLSGALSEVGLTFVGREHSGLDDAVNTAHLAGRMVSDGVLLRVTKQLEFP